MKCKHDGDPMTCLRCIAVLQGCKTEAEIDTFVQECEYWEERMKHEVDEEDEIDDLFDRSEWPPDRVGKHSDHMNVIDEHVALDKSLIDRSEWPPDRVDAVHLSEEHPDPYHQTMTTSCTRTRRT